MKNFTFFRALFAARSLAFLLLSLAGFAFATSSFAKTPEKVTIELTEFNMKLSKTDFKVGQSYIFEIKNSGAVGHEVMLLAKNFKDASAAGNATGGHGMMGQGQGKMGKGKMGQGHGDMVHGHGNTSGEWNNLIPPDHEKVMPFTRFASGIIDPKKSVKVEYTFTAEDKKTGVLLACLLIGHFEAGMHAAITVR